MKNEIILFENQNVRLKVNMKDETIWLNQEQMSKLFGRDRTVIARHINNIFKESELIKDEVCAKFAHTTRHGSVVGLTQTRELDFYNLLYKDGIRVIDNNTLVAITLLIAQSNPKEKDIMTDLVMNFII